MLYHFHKQFFAVIVSYDLPAELLCGCFECFFFEVLEYSMFAHRNYQVGNYFPFSDITLDCFGLHINTADKLHLRDHTCGFFLPVEDIDSFVVSCIYREINDRFGLVPTGIQSIIDHHLLTCSKHQFTRFIVFQFEQAVQRIRHIILTCIIHKIKNYQALFAICKAHSSAELLGIQHL